ncbi:MAG TPA: hypothetical protein VFO76_00740 [Candidatus Kapabacteria bacterium]|nr:hypothetical protein [Candidatus Kapabacteria bacterium]
MKLVDHLLIRVDNVWEETQVAGLQILNHHLYIEKERDRFERKRLYGIVEQLPAWLSGKMHQPLDPGWPNHRLRVGHDEIQRWVNQGNTDYHNNWEQYYNLAAKDELDYLTLADYPCDVQIGEKVYFHPSVTEEENQIEEGLFKCRPDQVICVVEEPLRGRDFSTGIDMVKHRFRMQAFHLLVEPLLEEQSILEEINEQKQMFQGIVRHGSLAGQKIWFQVDADWEVEIEGVMYYVMKEEDVFVVV